MTETERTLMFIYYHAEHGRSYYWSECSCGAKFRTYIWSFRGGGKKCPECGFVHSILSVAGVR